MTANDIRYQILLAVDSLFSGTAPGYNDKQMSAIINRAQRRVFRDYSRLFDSNEKIKRVLAPLVNSGSLDESDIVLATHTDITNYPHSTSTLTGTFYALPATIGRVVEEQVILKAVIGSALTQPVLVLPITYDYYMKNYKNRYKKPCTDLVWRMDAKLEDGKPCVELIYPITHTVDDYVISYLKYPTDMEVNVGTPGSQVSCDIIDTSFQDEIIGEAVKIITASLNDEGYQVVAAEKKFDEN
jgi:hypothetical protein